MKPKVLDGIVLVYGLFLIALGIVGYVRTQHVMSLMGGVTMGVLVLGFLAITAKKRQLGRIGVATISLLVALMFIGRFLAPASANPATPPPAVWQNYAGIVASLLVFLALGVGHMQAMKTKRLE